MGITLTKIAAFFDLGYVNQLRPRVLDIGCSNIHTIDADLARRFVTDRNDIYDDAALGAWARFFAAGGVMDPELGGTNGAWLGDLLERAGMAYKAYDIFPGYHTELFDLNGQSVPADEVGTYDVVFNFGTTEHVLGQYNAFKVIHDAARVGGIIYHDLPMTGHLNHGFFNYNPVLLVSIAKANDYEVLQFGFSGDVAGETIAGRLVPHYQHLPYFFDNTPSSDWSGITIPTAAVSMIVRKVANRPFRIGLETSTTAGTVAADIERIYGGGRFDQVAAKAAVRERTAEILGRVKDPSLTMPELWEYYHAFFASGLDEPFSYTIELRMLDDELKVHADDDQLRARRTAVLGLMRQTFPLLKASDKANDCDDASDRLEFDGREDGFDLSGPEDRRFARIVAAYRAYCDRSAVDLFPLQIEAIGLEYMVRTGPRDPELLLRLGKVMAAVTPAMHIQRRAGHETS